MDGVSSYQSEDQVVESRGGQQEQQDGEQQRSDEELKHTNTFTAERLSAEPLRSRPSRLWCGTWSRS